MHINTTLLYATRDTYCLIAYLSACYLLAQVFALIAHFLFPLPLTVAILVSTVPPILLLLPTITILPTVTILMSAGLLLLTFAPTVAVLIDIMLLFLILLGVAVSASHACAFYFHRGVLREKPFSYNFSFNLREYPGYKHDLFPPLPPESPAFDPIIIMFT